MKIKNLILPLIIFSSGCVSTSLTPRSPATVDTYDNEKCLNALKSIPENHRKLTTEELGQLAIVLPFSGDPIETVWSEAITHARQVFPDLLFTKPEDLHMTLLYIGSWQLEKLEDIMALATVLPSKAWNPSLSFKHFGSTKNLLVLSLDGVDQDWFQRAEAARRELNLRKLRNPGNLDFAFEPHISLAQTKSNTPTKKEIEELRNFEAWLKNSGFLNQKITVGPMSNFRFIVGDSIRPSGAPTLLPLQDFLNYLNLGSPH